MYRSLMTHRYVGLVLMASILAFCLTATSSADELVNYSTDFENFELGHLDPQVNGTPIINDPDPDLNWRGDGLTGLGGQEDYDADIVDLDGNQAFRISNPDSAATGNYDVTHPATPALTKIGETGSGGTLGTFSFGFDFMAASSELQEGLQINVTPFESGTASRHGILRISDDADDGFSVGWWETNDSGGFNFLDLATDLDRATWHTVSVSMTLLDGADNDLVEVDLNGTVTNTTTWEGYYRNAGGVQPETAPVDSLIFRIPTGSGPEGGGVYFDNLSTTASAVPEPASLAIWGGLSGIGLVLARRRRRGRQARA